MAYGDDPLILNGGDLRHEVSFAHAAADQDASGQNINRWKPYLTARAKIENLSGQQLFQAGVLSSRAIWCITIRWPGFTIAIKAGDRAFFQAHTFVVQIVDNILERNRVLKLTCLEIDGES